VQIGAHFFDILKGDSETVSMGFICGITGASIVSIIPNLTFRTIKINWLHGICILAGGIFGSILFIIDDGEETWSASLGYGLWFSSVGTTLFANFIKLSQSEAKV
jgi:hypothetical protein